MIRHISARVDILRDGVRCGSLPFPQSSPPSVMADSASAIKQVSPACFSTPARSTTSMMNFSLCS